jgi:hypothetical protein
MLPDLAFLLKKESVKKKDQVALQIHKVPRSYRSITPPDFNVIAREQFGLLASSLRDKGVPYRFLVFNPGSRLLLDNEERNYLECFEDVSVAVREIASSKALIGTRLHSSIVALTQGTPFRAFQYQGKVRGVIGMVCNQDRIIYPKDVLPLESFYPVEEFSSVEKKNLEIIRKYLTTSLDIIRKAAVRNDLKEISLPKFPLPRTVHKTYEFASLNHKPRFLRDLRDKLQNAIRKLKVS